jgi:hypothetical protein
MQELEAKKLGGKMINKIKIHINLGSDKSSEHFPQICKNGVKGHPAGRIFRKL